MKSRSVIPAIAIAVLLGACSSSNPSPQTNEPPVPDTFVPLPAIPKIRGPLPTSLVEANKAAEAVFNVVNSGNWDTAPKDLAALKQALPALHADIKAATDSASGPADAIGRVSLIESTFGQLSDAIRNRDRNAAMRESNRITKPIAELAEMFTPPIPGELMLLRHYSRQFAIAASTDDLPLLKQTAVNIRTIWAGLQSEVETRGGTVEAQRFNDLISELERGGMPGELPARLNDRIYEIEEILKR